ncbi:DUF881 domain-containing protein [Alloscardovia venturai]|uniref:DUF881 domain-containing protein n=1 Tax=Alloscardovia venturai TaxID=1769421 RepID=A0ABW2Y2W7_9BIFI
MVGFVREPFTRKVKGNQGRHRKKKSFVGAVATFVSFALVGWIAVANIQNTRFLSYHSNTVDIIRSRRERIFELQKSINSQAKQIETLQTVVGNTKDNQDSSNADSSSTTIKAVEGPGVTVTLSDSQKWNQVAKDADVNPNDYVVHQQDIEAVVAALWAGGAEAVTIQGERLLPTSAIKCVGNVLLLNGKQYAPPYVIAAIGDTKLMKNSLDDSEAVKIYKQYVDADGLGWQLDTSQLLHFKEVSISPQPMKYATVVEDKDNK